MPSPLMRMSLGDGACMAAKNIVLAPGLGPPFGAVDVAGAGAGAPELTGLPQLPQKRWPGAMASPQKAQTLGPAAAPKGSAGPFGAVSADFLATPSDAPQSWHTVALIGDSASHASQTSPIVIALTSSLSRIVSDCRRTSTNGLSDEARRVMAQGREHAGALVRPQLGVGH